MKTWQLQTAKAKLSELLNQAEKNGPQIITLRGQPKAVVVPIDEWNRTHSAPSKTLLQVLQSGPQYDLNIPPRGRFFRRKPVNL